MKPFETFRDRRIGQWIIGYAAAAWGVLQLLDFLASHFAWPDWIVRAATIFLIVNLLTAIILAWYHGERGPQRATAGELGMIAVVLTGAIGGAWVAARTTPAQSNNESHATSSQSDVSESSIAVLPFKNLSGNAQTDFFSDGITEEILDAIAKVPGLRVAARTSSFAFKGKDDDARLIAAKLGVAHLLMGSVQREGDSVRVTSQLYTVASNSNVWSDKYGGDANHLFTMEDQISKSIAEQLKKTIVAGTVLAANATGSEKAHELYLLGLDSWSRRTQESVHKAVNYFTNAVAADSTYAEAHAGLALALAVLPNYDSSVPAAPTFVRGMASARRALQIDPKSAAAYAAMSQMAEYSDDMTNGEEYARKAIALNPNYATAHQWLAEALWLHGRIADALVEINRAISLDPLSPVILSVRGFIHEAAGDRGSAVKDHMAALSIDPHFQGALNNLIAISLAAGNYDLARKIALQAVPPDGAFIVDTIVEGLRNPAMRPALGRLLRRPGLLDPNSTIVLAEIAGDRNYAVQQAIAAEKERVPGWQLWSTMSSPSMKGLREDPRFPAIYKWPRK